MKWTSYDKNQVTNLIISLKKAKFEMTGMEIVAFSEVFRWVSGLHDLIEKDLRPPSPVILSPASVVQEPKTLTPKVEPSEKTKPKRKTAE